MQQTCPTCGDVLGYNSPNCYRCTPNAVSPATAQAAASSSAAEVIVIVVVGFILMAGNITGLFPTFPYAGFILTLVGGLIAKSG
jgi:hypothetical protein